MTSALSCHSSRLQSQCVCSVCLQPVWCVSLCTPAMHVRYLCFQCITAISVWWVYLYFYWISVFLQCMSAICVMSIFVYTCNACECKVLLCFQCITAISVMGIFVFDLIYLCLQCMRAIVTCVWWVSVYSAGHTSNVCLSVCSESILNLINTTTNTLQSTKNCTEGSGV